MLYLWSRGASFMNHSMIMKIDLLSAEHAQNGTCHFLHKQHPYSHVRTLLRSIISVNWLVKKKHTNIIVLEPIPLAVQLIIRALTIPFRFSIAKYSRLVNVQRVYLTRLDFLLDSVLDPTFHHLFFGPVGKTGLWVIFPAGATTSPVITIFGNRGYLVV